MEIGAWDPRNDVTATKLLSFLVISSCMMFEKKKSCII